MEIAAHTWKIEVYGIVRNDEYRNGVFSLKKKNQGKTWNLNLRPGTGGQATLQSFGLNLLALEKLVYSDKSFLSKGILDLTS